MIDNISSFMPSDFGKKITNYIQVIRNKNNEFNKRVYFISNIMEDIFKINSDFIDVEEGRVDIYFAGVMFETKVKITEETKREAYTELKNYLKKNPNTVRCVITDGVIFEIYTPEEIKKYDSKKHNKLNPEKTFDIGTMDLENIGDYTWQDIFTNLYNMLYPKVSGLIPKPDIIASRISALVKRVYGQIDWDVTDTVKYKAWKSYVSIVFGNPDGASEELFKKQSILYYIVILITARVLGIKGESKSIINGNPFVSDGITNFVDKDNFFDILTIDGKKSDIILKAIEDEINRYDFSKINVSEEVFKWLYEDLASSDIRHNLGEFYTNSWLAKILVDNVIENNKTILDPACGSGTFIRLAIEEAKKLGYNVEVLGFDINPIAVVLARANYLIAKKDSKPHIIPIFLADTLMPEWKGTSSNMSWENYSEDFAYIDVNFDQIIGEFGKASFHYKPDWSISEMEKYIGRMFDIIEREKEIPDDMIDNKNLINKLKKLNEAKKNHIWSYILKNIYTPYYYRKKIDIVIGNPPWLTYKDVKNPLRQKFLDDLYKDYNMKAGSQNKSNQDMVGFFICRSKEFLKNIDSKIAFIVTRSVLNGAQYNGFRRGEWNLGFLESYSLKISKIWDIAENANPFNKPSCMILLIGEKKADQSDKPKEKQMDNTTDNTIGVYIIENKAKKIKNANINTEIIPYITEKEYHINMTKNSSSISSTQYSDLKDESEYKKLFRRGAMIYPRPYFFVDIKQEGKYGSEVSTELEYGINKNKRTSKGNFHFLFKDEWVPNLLKYKIILGSSIEKFKINTEHNVIIPVIKGKCIFTPKQENNGYVFELKAKDQLLPEYSYDEYESYFPLLQTYEKLFNDIEKDWERYRDGKFNIKGKFSTKMSVWDNINYGNKLLSQFDKQATAYMVMYNTSGKSIRSAVIHKDKTIVESTAYYYNTNSKGDAHFICGVLNSEYLYNILVKLGILSERHIHKKPFEIQIPKYNAGNPIHKKISDLSYEISELKKNNEDADSKIRELEEAVEELFKENINGIDT